MAYIQSGQNNAGAGTTTVTLTSVTAQSLLYGVVRAFGAASGLTVSTDRSDTVVKSVTALTVNDDYFGLWYVLSAVGGTTIVTLSTGVADTAILGAVEFGGFAGGAVVDAALVTNTGTSGTATGSAITTITSGAVVVSSAAAQPADADTTWTPTGGCTIRETLITAEKRSITGDQVKATPGSVTDTFTLDASQPWGVKTVAFSSATRALDNVDPAVLAMIRQSDPRLVSMWI